MFWILEYLHINNEISWGIGPKSKHKIHLSSIYTCYTWPDSNFYTMLFGYVHFDGKPSHGVRCGISLLLTSFQCSKVSDFGSFWDFRSSDYRWSACIRLGASREGAQDCLECMPAFQLHISQHTSVTVRWRLLESETVVLETFSKDKTGVLSLAEGQMWTGFDAVVINNNRLSTTEESFARDYDQEVSFRLSFT